MKGPYIKKESWPDFFYRKQHYSLSHLDEYRFSVKDGQPKERHIAVTFSDHCFTRKYAAGNDLALVYQSSDRKPGCFSFERYRQSLDLRTHIERASLGRVWNAGNGRYLIVPTVTRASEQMLYVIVFSLDPVKGLPIDLHMRIRTAYLHEQRLPRTFGEVRFRHLVDLRMRRKHPEKLSAGNRRTPRLA